MAIKFGVYICGHDIFCKERSFENRTFKFFRVLYRRYKTKTWRKRKIQSTHVFEGYEPLEPHILHGMVLANNKSAKITNMATIRIT
jgi:hypothetical protein